MKAIFNGEPDEEAPDVYEYAGLIFKKGKPTEIPAEVERVFMRDHRFDFIQE